MIEIIPAIDIIDGKCVRLTQGDYQQKKVYNENPLEVAKMFEDWGIKRLHLVDLDGARASHIVNHRILEEISKKTGLVIDFGGGIKSDEDVRLAFDSGAEMITVGSIAVRSPEKVQSWLEEFGNERIILGADHHNGKIAVSGWTHTSDVELIGFIKDYRLKGVKKVICTDISLDGMLTGPSIDIYKQILKEINEIYLIASGGVSQLEDISKLERIGVQSVIIGKAIYEGRITESDLQDFLI